MSGERDARDVAVRVALGPAAAPIVARVAVALAARADLPFDRVNEAGLVADALVAHAPARVDDGHLGLTARTAPGRLELRVGPLRTGGAEGLLQDSVLPDVGPVLRRLADEVRIERDGGHEHLVLLMGR